MLIFSIWICGFFALRKTQVTAAPTPRSEIVAFPSPVLTEVVREWRAVAWLGLNGVAASICWMAGFALQKTGYITEAGQCLVMQTKLAGRKLIMVLLDSAGKYSRIADAERIRKWLLSNHPTTSATASPTPIGTLDSKLKPTS